MVLQNIGHPIKDDGDTTFRTVYDVEVYSQPSEVYGAIVIIFNSKDGGVLRKSLHSDGKWPTLSQIEALSVREYREYIRHLPPPLQRKGLVSR